MKKRVTSAFLSLVMLLALLPASAFAATEIASGYCGGEGDGTNLWWTLDSDGALTISGKGEMGIYNIEGKNLTPWHQLRDNIRSVTIQSGVSSIGNWAFSRCSNLLSVIIPDSVTNICMYAFYECGALNGVTIPDSVTYIGSQAFFKCNSLTDIVIPNSVITIASNAFCRCEKLTSVIIGSGVANMDSNTFSGCDMLKSITVASNNEAFSSDECGVLFDKAKTKLLFYPTGNIRTSYMIPDSVTYISDFTCKYLTSVTIPTSVSDISRFAFYSCGKLADIYYPGSEEQWYDLLTYINRGYDSVYNIYLYYAAVHFNYTGGSTITYIGGEPMIITDRRPTATVEFCGGITKYENQTVTMTIPWSFDYFGNSAEIYNNNLAIAGLILSANSNSDKSSKVDSTLRELGFRDIVSHYYDGEGYDGFDRVGQTFGYQKIAIDGVQTNIIAVICRGTQNGTSDLASDILTNEAGYLLAANNVYDHLDAYLKSHNLTFNDNIRFFIAGHSRGGAVAADLAVLLSSYTATEDIFAYTFASPSTISSPVDTEILGVRVNTCFRNIFNVVNNADIVPQLLPWHYRFGLDKRFGTDYSGVSSAFSTLTGGLVIDDALNYKCGFGYDKALGALPIREHAPVVYLSYLLTKVPNADNARCWIDKISVKCPVDVEVYDKYGNLIGRIIDNVPDEALSILVEVDGDEKYIYLPDSNEYVIKLIGSDGGEMEYSVEKLDAETWDVVDEKTFSGVALLDGKTMASTVAQDISTPDIQLFVTDGEQKTKEISTAGTEQAICTVSFYTDGGTELRDASVITGEKLSLPAAPKKYGYVFENWYADNSLNSPFDANSPVTQNMTLYAKFEPAYDICATFSGIEYNGDTITTSLQFQYNNCNCSVLIALYEDGRMVKLTQESIMADTNELAIQIQEGALYGNYELKAFFLADNGLWSPLCEKTASNFFAV